MLDVIDLSRLQFALTALYHFIFVPLTLGLSFVLVIMETIYVATGKEVYKDMTRFWGKLFGINFALGVTTGIIMEFQFGTNWSYYSHYVGDIFGAPLAIEALLAFFLESTFVGLFFFGWDRLTKGKHLLATYCVAFGSNLSAMWILVANGWMQFPAGMHFDPDTARNEMISFTEVLFSPVAINKFLHTVTSGYVLAAIFVIGVSAWFILKGRHLLLAQRSILVAGIFGFLSLLAVIATGDGSAYQVAQKQPMKLAAMEGLYRGKEGTGLVAVGVLNPSKTVGDEKDPFLVKIELPHVLSWLGYHDFNAFVPGVEDLLEGGFSYTAPNGEQIQEPSAQQKIEMGRTAINALRRYTEFREAGDKEGMATARAELEQNFKYFGYGYLNDTKSIVPNVPLSFYAFHIMVLLGGLFLLFFIVVLYYSWKRTFKPRWLLIASIVMIPLVYLCSQAGWIVAEVGRQPWVIQDIMPTFAAVSRIDASAVQVTFFIFAILFTVLLIAELSIMVKQIKLGPKEK